jgi:hypothetical protein
VQEGEKKKTIRRRRRRKRRSRRRRRRRRRNTSREKKKPKEIDPNPSFVSFAVLLVVVIHAWDAKLRRQFKLYL